MQITIWKYNTASPSHMVPLAPSVSPQPVKCFALCPKWVVDPGMHEVVRSVRLQNNGILENISWTLKNKTGLFQEDLYPPTKTNEPSAKFEDFAAGKKIEAKMFQVKEDYKFTAGADVALDLQSKDPNVVALGEAKKKIAELEKQLAEQPKSGAPAEESKEP